MSDCFQGHPDAEAIERFVFGELAEPKLAPVEEHLLVCETCRHAVAEMDAFAALVRPSEAGRARRAAYVHTTADGPVTLEIRRLSESNWSAQFCGPGLEGQALVGSAREACAYLRRSFAEMFPEHLCGAGCRPVD